MAGVQHPPKKNSVLSSIFLSSEGVKPIEIYGRMKVQYDDVCLSLQQVYEWTKKSINGIRSVTGSSRPGQAHRVLPPEATAAVDAIVKENRRVWNGYESCISPHIVHDVLQFRIVSANWAPRQLTAVVWTTCWCLPWNFETLWSRRWRLSRKNCFVRWNLGPLPPAGSKELCHTSSPKPKKISHTTICGKGYADSLLGWTRGNFGALNVQGEHCDQCNVCRSPKESPASCNQVQTTWTSEYWCFDPTWQCSAPYYPFNCCNIPRSVLPVFFTTAVLARPRSQSLSCRWTAQRGDGRQVFQVRRRGAAGRARVAALSAKIIFF
jgi:hypothetical protein